MGIETNVKIVRVEMTFKTVLVSRSLAKRRQFQMEGQRLTMLFHQTSSLSLIWCMFVSSQERSRRCDGPQTIRKWLL